MKQKYLVSVMIPAIFLLGGKLLARPTTPHEAEKVVTGWCQTDAQPLGALLGQTVTNVETFYNDQGKAIYYIANLKPSGFVIVSADDLVEPIIGFTSVGTFDSLSDNPLWTLVQNDLKGRIAEAGNASIQQATVEDSQAAQAQSKWAQLMNIPQAGSNGYRLMGLSHPSDIRVIPFVQSRWGQTVACGQNCYNYYSPRHYPTGCLATAIAQLMRYYEYPTDGIGSKEFMILIDDKAETHSTLGGDGSGGPYQWNDMVLQPYMVCRTLTETQRQAIGAICYDAGLAIHMEYTSDGSGALMFDTKMALLEIFKYSNVVMGYHNGGDIGPGLNEMINPNLDAKIPVVLGIMEESDSIMGHAVLCDGYGYQSSTLYHHLNMGWEGIDDVWYNLPTIHANNARFEFNSIIACLYNIYMTGDGEIISGRVFDHLDNTLVNAIVYAQSGTQDPYIATTDDKGIYALQGLDSDITYRMWVEKDGFIFPRKSVKTGTSRDGDETSGNCWEIDFYPQIVLDPPPPRILYVDNDAPGDPGPDDVTISDPTEDGSEDHPYDTIQEAIDSAGTGETVIVLPGVYTGSGNRDLDLKNKAITVRSTDPNDPAVIVKTVIDCNASQDDPHRGFIFQSYETPQSVVTGISITRGFSESGGAILITQYAAPTLINCIFRDNEASYGGAMYIDNTGPTFTNCQFNDNRADGGGAIYAYGEDENSAPILEDCVFRGNSATYNGGAIYNIGDVHSMFENCLFMDNVSSGGGGAIRNISSTNLILTNCIFGNNQAQSFGGGIRNSHNSNCVLTNCTFSSNSAAYGSSLASTVDDQGAQASGSFAIVNCIIQDLPFQQAGSGNEIYNGDYSTITVSYSNVPNSFATGPWMGEGNIYADPYFADAENGDFHLKSQAGRYDSDSQSWILDDVTSPCIDAGDSRISIGEEPSPNGGVINIGAYGGTTEASKSILSVLN